MFTSFFFFCNPLDEQEPSSAPTTTRAKRKSKYQDYTTAPPDSIYFLFDVETTGSKRNYDRIIAISFLAYDQTGNRLGNFSTKINPDNVKVTAFLTHNVHGIVFVCSSVQRFFV